MTLANTKLAIMQLFYPVLKLSVGSSGECTYAKTDQAKSLFKFLHIWSQLYIYRQTLS